MMDCLRSVCPPPISKENADSSARFAGGAESGGHFLYGKFEIEFVPQSNSEVNKTRISPHVLRFRVGDICQAKELAPIGCESASFRYAGWEEGAKISTHKTNRRGAGNTPTALTIGPVITRSDR